jgi:hypothetical protein
MPGGGALAVVQREPRRPVFGGPPLLPPADPGPWHGLTGKLLYLIDRGGRSRSEQRASMHASVRARFSGGPIEEGKRSAPSLWGLVLGAVRSV